MSTWRTKYIGDKLAKRTFKAYNGYAPNLVPEDQRTYFKGGVDSHVGRYRKTRKPCSCRACGNPRKYLGNSKNAKTFQEIKSDLEGYSNWKGAILER